MKCTLFVCNPKKNSLSRAVKDKIQSYADEHKIFIRTVDLYADSPNTIISSDDIDNYDSGVIYPDLREIMEVLNESEIIIFYISNMDVWHAGSREGTVREDYSTRYHISNIDQQRRADAYKYTVRCGFLQFRQKEERSRVDS